MKTSLYLLVIAFVATSCKKHPTDYVGPNGSTSTGSTTTQENTTTQIPAPGQFTSINFTMPDQVLKMSIDGNNLNIAYNEDVVLLTQTQSLKNSYAVHFKEDFSASDLANFDYYSLTKEGVNAFDWVDDNLNNINKTLKDTVINNVAITKIEVKRTFNFIHTFSTEAEASTEYNKLINDKSQSINFSAYYAPTTATTIASVGKANLLYIANK